jgi:hypothetical protein
MLDLREECPKVGEDFVLRRYEVFKSHQRRGQEA